MPSRTGTALSTSTVAAGYTANGGTYMTEEKPNIWLTKNDPIPLMLKTAATLHIGDEELIVSHLASAHSLGLGEKVDPLHEYLTGRSSGGKGHTAGTTIRLLPEKMVITLASFSPKAFHYVASAEKENLDRKIVHIPEVTIVGQDEEKLGLLRILTDSPSDSKRGEHWTVDDKRQPLKLKISGRLAVWLNSVTPLPDKELKNRFLIGNPNESEAQDIEVQQRQTNKLALLGNLENDEQIKFCQDVNQYILDEKIDNVIVPHAKFISFPYTKNRRLYPMFLTTIKAITKMRFSQREEIKIVGNGKTVEALLATPEDIETSRWVFNKLLSVTVSQASQQALDLLELIPDNQMNELSKNALADLTGLSADWCYRKCTELLMAGLIRSETRERQLYYWKAPSRSTCLNSGIRVEWEKIGEKELLEAFQSTSVAKPDQIKVDTYCKQYANYQNPKPTWLIELEEKNATQYSESSSEIRDKTSDNESSNNTTARVRSQDDNLTQDFQKIQPETEIV